MTGCPLFDSEYAARQNGKRLPCERLAEENAKLLMRVNAEHIVRQNLAAENAKLRELVREACEMARTFYNLGGTYNDLDDLLCEANELGVEV